VVWEGWHREVSPYPDLRRIFLIAAQSGGGRLTERTAVIRPRRREWVKVPLCGHSLRSAATAYDAPLRQSFDAYFGRIIGSHALSFARTMRRRRAPERHMLSTLTLYNAPRPTRAAKIPLGIQPLRDQLYERGCPFRISGTISQPTRPKEPIAASERYFVGCTS
jgi:hypothetical protein